MARFLLLRRLVVALIMFPAAVRAFAPQLQRRTAATRGLLVRWMTDGGDGEEPKKSVVDTCREKIERALETDAVTVKGGWCSLG